MEPILSKLQEGVKYPRFEKDATKTINDLVEHITKERGVYSSSIEPNPSEHSIWFNTNDNTLYIYNGNTWTTVSATNVDISISKNMREFYPYPVINIYDRNTSLYNDIERNNHYIIIINTDNIINRLNEIVTNNDDIKFIIIGDNINTSGTFLINIYDTYIYYIRLSSSYIEEDNVFYLSEGALLYTGNNDKYGMDGIIISGFYSKKLLKYVIEENEGNSLEKIGLDCVFIDAANEATIIIGKQNFDTNVVILGTVFENSNIYMYNNILEIGSNSDLELGIDNLYWDDITMFCNCKQIGNITVIHEESGLYLEINCIDFVVGNNNKLIIHQTVADCINECNIFVLKETNDDTSNVLLPDAISGKILSYVNMCGTKIIGGSDNTIPCNTFITTTIDDINYSNMTDSCINFNTCKCLIIDATYKSINTGFINYLRTCIDLKVYTTSQLIYDFLNENGLPTTFVRSYNTNYTDRIQVTYKLNNGDIIYNRTIYKR